MALFPVAVENGTATVARVHHVADGSGILDSELARHAPQPGKDRCRHESLYYNTITIPLTDNTVTKLNASVEPAPPEGKGNESNAQELSQQP